MKRFYLSGIVLLVALLSGLSQRAVAQTSSFIYTGSMQSYVVPAGCSGVQVDLAGAAGGNYSCNVTNPPGNGGRVQCNLAVTPGQTLYIYVGQQGGNCNGGAGGSNSGGGANGGTGGNGGGGAGGGGSTDIRTVSGSTTAALSSRVVVGGAGSGTGWDAGENGANAGYPNGSNGVDGGGGWGGGATQTTGGNAGCEGTCGSAGSFGAGGNAYCCWWGSGGGGGWYGGGGAYAGSGGGGSSYAGTGTSGVNFSLNTLSSYTAAGNGYCNITPLVPVVTATPASIVFPATTVGTTAIPPKFTTLSGVYMGAGPLTLTLSGAPAGVFTLATDAVPTFGPGPGSLTITSPTFPLSGAPSNVYINFTPAAAITYSGTLTITGGGLGTPLNIPINGTGVNVCTGAPSGGITVASPTSGGIYTAFNLSLSPAPASGGLTYQWQSSSSSGGPWANITGAVLPNYSFTGISTTTFFQCIVTCSATGTSATYAPSSVTFAGLAGIGCTPTDLNGYSSGFTVGTATYPFFVSGTLGSLTDAFPSSGTTVYHDFSASLNVTEAAGTTISTCNIGGTQAGTISVQMWVDFNNDGNFATSESIGGLASIPLAPAVGHPVLTIPAGIAPGVYRFRVVLDYAIGNPVYPNIAPCPTTAYSYADTRDYTMIIAPPACSGTPIGGLAVTTQASSCAPPFSFTPTLLDIGGSTATGVTYNWQSATSLAGPYTNVGGAVNSIYTPTITTTGVTYYRMSATCAASTGYSSPISVSLNPVPTPISGSFNLCTGVPSTLISTPGGGTWTSSAPLVASTPGTNIVTGNTVGLATITYTLPTGCMANQQVTVNTQPAAIAGPSAVCTGSAVTLTDVTPGGTWISSTTGVGTIGASTGAFGAIAPGTTSITYSSPAGCISTPFPLLVNPNPTIFLVGGGGPVCAGSASTWSVTLNGSSIGVTYQLLLNGSASGMPSLPGSGTSLNFGIQSAPGVYTVMATNNITGCSKLMVSSATISINPLPLQFTVSGGGSYCAGSLGSAPHVIISGSQSGVNYKLYNGLVLVLTLSGSGGALDFGPQTAAGCYTVVAQNAATGCVNSMLGSACVTINSLPTAFDITPAGGGGYCVGGSGVDIQLDFSNTGISYELLIAGTTHVATLSGTGGVLDFGMQTTAGTYTIKATNVSTSCQAMMAGASTITVNLPPTQHNISTAAGGSSGSYCAGDLGVEVVMDASDGGINYQLYLGTIPVGPSIGGTGLPLSFGMQTGAGTYTVIATDATSGCTNNMLGAVAITINPLPPMSTVTGGGNFCIGGPGVHIGINPTSTGISYQLLQGGTPLGSAIMGTGGSVDFGVFSTVGIYTVVATNMITGCTRTMAGVATISTNPLPFGFNVTGTGSYCAGGSGINVGLDFSATGITYQLLRNGVNIGAPISGTGATIGFGLQTVAGTYTVIGTNVSTGCTGPMAGSAVITVSALPLAHLVTGGGNFCAGDTGRHIVLNGSEIGTTYQLYLGLTPVGSTMAGTGSLLDFGLQTLGGTYTVIAANGITGCSRYMVGGAPVNVYPLPGAFIVTGGGLYCAGSPGVHIGLSGSVSGIDYQLYNGTGATGIAVSGTGGAIDFGIHTAAGTYTVMAANHTTGCQMAMTGSVSVATSPLPGSFTVTGGGSYCAGGTGSLVGLDGSEAAVNYQLYHGTTLVGTAVMGTGAAISFGPMTGTGVYTVKATNSVSGCMNNMAGSANIVINPLPAVYPVTGGGNYCAGGAGFHVILTGSGNGVNYQLYNGTTATGLPAGGTGSAVDFGVQTASGSYTVVATDAVTGCSMSMSGSAAINIYPLPATHTVTGGGAYCAGGAGVNIGLDGSEYGVLYQLFQGTTPVGVAIPGTGSNVNFGLHTAAATYTIVATNNATYCTSNMTGSVTVSISPLPTAFNVTGGGPYCATGLGSNVLLGGSETGVNYQLWLAGTPVGSLVSGTGSTIDFGPQSLAGGYTVSASNATTTCADNMTGSVSVSILPNLYPHTTITSSTGLACVGQTVNFTGTPVAGGSAPTFQWIVNGVSVGIGSSYSYIPVNGDVVVAVIHSNYQCAFPTYGHDTMIMAVSPPEMPSATVSVSPGTQICTGGTATFTATTAYGGSAPDMRWIRNSVFAGTGSTFSFVPNNGDVVTFMLASNFPCRLSDTVFSANTTLDVQAPVLPVVSISTTPGNNIAIGQSITFTASVVHGASTPRYQWVINSTMVPGATNQTFTTSALANNDSVTCMSEGTCGLTGFNSVSIHVHAAGVGVNNVTGSGSEVSLIPNPNKGDFTVKGTLSSNMDQVVTLEVTNMLGQVIYNSNVTAQGGNINEHIQLKNMPNGMYLMNLRSGEEKVVFHFVVEQ